MKTLLRKGSFWLLIVNEILGIIVVLTSGIRKITNLLSAILGSGLGDFLGIDTSSVDKANAGATILSVVFLIVCVFTLILKVVAVREMNLYGEKVINYKPSMNYLIVILLGIITLGIYPLFWLYRYGNSLNRMCKGYGVEMKSWGTYFLILSLFVPFGNCVIWCIIFNVVIKLRESEWQDEKEDVTVKAFEGVIRGITGAYSGATIDFSDKNEIVIGRDPSIANIIIDENSVSGIHCKINFDNTNQRFIVIDMSKNGVFFSDGRRMQSNVPVICSVGTVLKISDDTNVFLLDVH